MITLKEFERVNEILKKKKYIEHDRLSFDVTIYWFAIQYETPLGEHGNIKKSFYPCSSKENLYKAIKWLMKREDITEIKAFVEGFSYATFWKRNEFDKEFDFYYINA